MGRPFSPRNLPLPMGVSEPPCNGPLGPAKSLTQTASRSVQPFLYSSPQSTRIFYNGLLVPPQNCPCPWVSGPHLIHGSSGQSEPKTQTASRSVRPFLHSLMHSVHAIYNGPPFPPQNCPFPLGIWTLGLSESSSQTASRSGEPFCRASRDRQTDRLTDRPTDHATRSVTIGAVVLRCGIIMQYLYSSITSADRDS